MSDYEILQEMLKRSNIARYRTEEDEEGKNIEINDDGYEWIALYFDKEGMIL